MLFLGILFNSYIALADEQKRGFKGMVMLGGGLRIVDSHLFVPLKDTLFVDRQDGTNVMQTIPLFGGEITYNGVTHSAFLKGFSGRNLGGLKIGGGIRHNKAA